MGCEVNNEKNEMHEKKSRATVSEHLLQMVTFVVL